MTAVAFAQQQFSFPPEVRPRAKPAVALVPPAATGELVTIGRNRGDLRTPDLGPRVAHSGSSHRPSGHRGPALGEVGTVATHRRPLSGRPLSGRPMSGRPIAAPSVGVRPTRRTMSSRPAAPAGPVWMLRAALVGAVTIVGVIGLFVATQDSGLPSSGPLAPVEASAAVDGSIAVHVVQPGDTLWSIAAAVAPGSDPRPIVDELARRSGGVGLQPGQRIALDGLER